MSLRKWIYPVGYICDKMEGRGGGGGGGRACDPVCGGRGFQPRCGRPLPTGGVGVSIM